MQDIDQAGEIENAPLPQEGMPAYNHINNYFREKVEAEQPGLNNIQKGIEILKAAGAKGDVEKTGIDFSLDSDIQRLSADIRKERAKAKPNTSQISFLVRQLAVLLLKKSYGIHQEFTQAEIDRMAEDILKVAGTYNNIWSLLFNIGAGTLGVVAGLCTAGASVAGLAQLGNGVTKVTSAVTQWQQVGSGFSSASQGIEQAAGRTTNSHFDMKRSVFQNDLNQTQSRKEAVKTAADILRNAISQQLNRNQQAEDSKSTAKARVLGATS